MTDEQALALLRGKYQRSSDLARALGITPQRLHNWPPLGPDGRIRVWMLARRHGAKLKDDFLLGGEELPKAAK